MKKQRVTTHAGGNGSHLQGSEGSRGGGDPRGKDGLRKGDKRTEPADHLGGNDELGFGWAGK